MNYKIFVTNKEIIEVSYKLCINKLIWLYKYN